MEAALIPHLIRKDLRHVRILFSLWAALLVGQAVLLGVGFKSGPDEFLWQTVYTVAAFGMPFLQSLVGVVLIALLIQDEPLVGSTAFWFTRPISRGTLLGAKATFALLLLILPPLVVQTVMFTANGISPRDTLLMLPEVLVTSVALIASVGALAVITRNFAQFILWLVIFWVVLTVASMAIQFGRMVFSENYLVDAQNMTLAYSRTLASSLLMMIGGLAVIITQYLTRRTRVSIGLLVTATVAQLLVQIFWSYDFFKKPPVPASAQVFPAGSVQVSLENSSAFANDAVQFGRYRAPQTAISGRMTFAEVPADYQLDLKAITSKLTFSNQETINSDPLLSVPYMNTNVWWSGPLSHALDQATIVNGDQKAALYSQVFILSTEEFQKRKTTPGTLEATLTLAARKIELMGRLPLQPGSRLDLGARHIEVGQVLRQTDGCRIIMRERRLNFWWDRMPAQFSPVGQDDGVYLLVNRERKQALLPDQTYQVDMASLMLRATAPLINRSFFLQFTGERDNRQVFTLDDAWLAGAELVRVEGKPAGELQRKLVAPNFLLQSR